MPQTQSLRYSFVNKISDTKYEQLHKLFLCRDYFCDCIYGNIHNKKIQIYGFTWDAPHQKLDSNKTRILIVGKEVENLINNIDRLNTIEAVNGFSLTQIIPILKNKIIIEGDPIWMSNTFMISLYSFLFRIMSYELLTDNWIKEVMNNCSVDSNYLNRIGKNKFSKLLTLLSEIPDSSFTITGFSNIVDTDINYIHNYSGIMGKLCSDYRTGAENSYQKKIDRLLFNKS